MPRSHTGSALYVFGDQVNDNGPYSVFINDTLDSHANYTGRSGCGTSDYAKYCEKLGGLKYFVGGLPQGTHKFLLVNGGPSSGNETFFSECQTGVILHISRQECNSR